MIACAVIANNMNNVHLNFKNVFILEKGNIINIEKKNAFILPKTKI